MDVKQRIESLLKQLNKGIYEKEEVIALALLSSIAGESIFLLGPPGVAKSLIARRLKYAYEDAKVFEYLMSRFSTPDEIFGPVSISKLKNDTYERIIENYLPSASVVFLDEIWKAGPSIQNALLTILNEKLYRNGAEEISVPMKALISASNELPAKDQGLEALWDRFLVRLDVGGIEDREKFNEMIAMPSVPFEDKVSAKITGDEYKTWSVEIDNIKIPENVFHVIHAIRNYIEQYNQNQENAENQIYVSDRRWRKITRLLRTAAFLNDRTEVDLMDCFLIKHCIWNDEDQIDTAFQFVSGAVEKHGYTVSLDLSDVKKELEDIDNDVKEWTKDEIDVPYDIPKQYKNSNKIYYKFDDTYDSNCNLICEDEKKKLIKGNFVRCELKESFDRYSNQIEMWLRLSDNENEIHISEEENSKEYDVCSFECETEMRKEFHPYLKRAHPDTIKGWDKRINVVKTKTGNMKSQIDSFRSNGLKHIHTNIFGKTKYVDIIENNLNDIEKQIELLEIEADHICHAYNNIKPSDKNQSVKLIPDE